MISQGTTRTNYTLLTFKSGPEIAGYSFLLLLIAVTLSGFLYTVFSPQTSASYGNYSSLLVVPPTPTNGDPLRVPLHRFFSSASFTKCAIDFPGHNRLWFFPSTINEIAGVINSASTLAVIAYHVCYIRSKL